MSLNGALRSMAAAARRVEREERRQQREYERQEKLYNKMQELEQAAYEVDVYENKIKVFQSIHKDCSDPIDWETIASSNAPHEPVNLKEREIKAKEISDNYKAGFFDKLFKQEDKKRKSHVDAVSKAIEEDELNHNDQLVSWKEKHSDWVESVQLAQKIIGGDTESKIEAIKQLDPFAEISTIGSSLTLRVNDNSLLEIIIKVHGDNVIPLEVKGLLKSGRLSVKKMPKGQFNELYQDYICSCILRVANEVFSAIPEERVIVTAVDKLLNTKTGHLEDSPILSACISHSTLQSLNLNSIDPSDSMSNFIHNMSFKKTKGFDAVEQLEAACLDH